MPLVGEMTEVTFFCLQRSVFLGVLVDFSCHQSTFMAIKIIMQELRDIAFKFSSAMTGVTEKAARLKSWQQTEPHRNGVISVFTAFWTTSPTPHKSINITTNHHHQDESIVTFLFDRWMTCTAKAVNAFGFAAAHEYVKVQGGYDDGIDELDDDREMMTAIDMSVCQANFAEESKAQADAMVEDLRAAFKELVRSLLQSGWT